MDEGRAVGVAHLGFGGAFDGVSRDILVGRLGNCGLDGWAVGWTGGWLGGGSRLVTVGGAGSGWGLVASGVLRGSVPGPVLFGLFINDIGGLLSGGFAGGAELGGLAGTPECCESSRRILTVADTLCAGMKHRQCSCLLRCLLGGPSLTFQPLFL